MSDPTPVTVAPGGRRYQQQLARTLRVAGNMTITLSVIGPAASVFAIGSIALRQQGSGALLAFLIAGLISGCLAVAWAELGALYPTTGGLYGIVACSSHWSSSSQARSRWPPASTWPPSGQPSTPGRPRWSCWSPPRR